MKMTELEGLAEGQKIISGQLIDVQIQLEKIGVGLTLEDFRLIEEYLFLARAIDPNPERVQKATQLGKRVHGYLKANLVPGTSAASYRTHGRLGGADTR
jgi:hypothetical protein